MENFEPMIGIYIPGINYISVGPGFVDAIKLEARDLYYPEKKYKVYTKYVSETKKEEHPYIYRQVIGGRINTPKTSDPVSSVQYSNDENRCNYGYFYDYIDSDPNDSDGGLKHTLTCFSNKSRSSSVESFTVNDRDGIYVIEADSADSAIELIFTFYTLSYDQYDHSVEDKPKDPISVHSCPDEYIEIGTMTKIVRASTLGQNIEADMIAEEGVNMYYDITKKDDETTLYLPINGKFKPVVGLESENPKLITCGTTIFDPYQEDKKSLDSSTDWGTPIVVDVNDFISTSDNEKIEQACLSAYIPTTAQYTANEATEQKHKEYFSPPTFVDINLYRHVSQHIPKQLDLHSLNVNSANMLWTTIPTFAVQNLTYNTKLQNKESLYVPVTILEYMPELGSIEYNVTGIKEKLTTIKVSEGEQSLQHFTYTGIACLIGRFFSFALSKLPHTKFNILQYCNNFKFDRPSTSDDAKAFFVKRPSYIKDVADSNSGLTSQNTSLFKGPDMFKGTLMTDGYSIDSTSQYNYLLSYYWSDDDIKNIYPLKRYFEDIDVKSQDNWKRSYDPQVTLSYNLVNANKEIVNEGSNTVKTWFTSNKSAYCHIFTTSDLENLPSILGKNKIYTSDSFVDIPDLYSETRIPIMSMNKRWGYSDVFCGTNNMIIPDRTEKSPSHRFYPINDYSRMLDWVNGFSEFETKYKVGSDPCKTNIEDYQQTLVLSPMLAVDMDESNTTLSNKGDYKVIPAYYYGDANNTDTVLTDYKHQIINVKPVDSGYQLQIEQVNGFTNPTSTFIDYAERAKIYTLSPAVYKKKNVKVKITIDKNLKRGLYVLKFNKFCILKDGISLNPYNKAKLTYTHGGKKYTTDHNFVALLINSLNSEYEIDVEFSIPNTGGKAHMADFKLYSVDMSDNTNLNQVLLNHWYQQNKTINQKYAFIPDEKSNNLLYDNIIFPSAVCAYENFTLFAGANGDEVENFTKVYQAVYFPTNPIYNIIGMYDIKNTVITKIDDLPSDIKPEEVICYNQTSRYV